MRRHGLASSATLIHGVQLRQGPIRARDAGTRNTHRPVSTSEKLPGRIKQRLPTSVLAAYHFGPYRFTDSGILWQGDRLVALTPLQRRMLSCFCRNPRELLSKSVLMEQVWGHGDVSEMSLARSVHGLRRKLGTARQGAELIRNVYGEGYIFTPAVEQHEEAAAASLEAALVS